MNKIDMKNLGLSERFITESTLYEGLYIGRVVSQYKNLYKVTTETGELTAEVSGKFRFNTTTLSNYPAVGDFVMIDRIDNKAGNAIIHHILTRKSILIRKAAGTSNDEQIIASNIDTIFICMSLNKDFNLRRIERYLGIAWDSGAIPVIVLTKSDLCNNLSEKLVELDTVACGVDVIVTSSISEDGYLSVKDYIHSGETIAFIGSSGVGKSTRREMFLLPNGGVVIDTPGMREIGLESADLSKTFTDIDELSTRCKFNDCTHTNEPKCAVQEALEQGLISKDRLESYKKLKKETKYEGLNSKQIENQKIAAMFKDFGGMNNARKFIKSNNKKR